MTNELAYELDQISKTSAFLDATPEMQQTILRNTRDEYIAENPKDSEYAQSVAEERNKTFLRSTGQGRHIPTNLKIDAPWQSEDFEFLSEEERQTKIEKFKLKIPEIAAQDTLNKEDNEFYLKQVADAQIRAVKGEDTGYIADKAYRAFDGFAAGLANYVGAEEIAENIRRSSAENPKYDEDFGAILAQGAGDMAASTAIFLGAAAAATAVTGNPVAGGYAGTTATLATNGISRYNEAYRIAIEKGLDDNQAHEAGIFSLPGAAVDALGDRLIASKLLPTRINRNFNVPDGAAKRKALTDLIADKSKRGVIMEVARNAFVEGASEAVGDYTAGYGGFLATGETDFIPKGNDLAKSFAVGAILGGGISAASDVPGLIRKDSDKLSSIADNIDKLSVDRAKNVYDLVAQGKYNDALKYSKEALASAGTSATPATGSTGSATPAAIPTPPNDLPENESADPTGKPLGAKPGVKPANEQEININSLPPDPELKDREVSNQTFLAATEADDIAQQQASQTTAIPGEKPEARQERAAATLVNNLNSDSRSVFESTVKRQLSSFLKRYSITEFIQRLGGVRAETESPIKGIRAGTANAGGRASSKAGEFVRDMSLQTNNIKLVDPNNPASVNERGLADFSVLEREEGNVKPIGKFNVVATNLNTKIQEEVARGTSTGITAVTPVNKQDEQFLRDNNVPFLDIGDIKGIDVIDIADTDEKYYVASKAKAVKALTDKLDNKYGVGGWVLKSSVGYGGNSVWANARQVMDFFNEAKKDPEQGGITLNGLYAEVMNEDIALESRKENTDFRVHAVKRNGKIEIIPFATHSRYESFPYFVRTSGVRLLEEAARKALNDASDSIQDNEFFGVDVVMGTDGKAFVTELNPTQFGDVALDYGIATGQSGYIENEYIQAATYAHLKGRVPAFVLAARKIMRDEVEARMLEQGSFQIANNIRLLFNAAGDQIAFANELRKNYGEKIGDYATDIYNAFTESLGNITQKVIDAIQRIIDTIRYTPVNPVVRPVNQPTMNKAKANTQSTTTAARGQTTVNKQSETKPKNETKQIKGPGVDAIYKPSAEGTSYPKASRGNVAIAFVHVDDIISELKKLSTIKAKLEWLHTNGFISSIGDQLAVDHSGRPIVLVRFGDTNVPFYISSGMAGKKDVEAGKWYIIWGIGKSGWMNKGDQASINNHYNVDIFKKAAKLLNEGLGYVDPNSLPDIINFSDVNDKMNLGITPIDTNTSDPKSFWQNVDIARLAAHNALVKQSKEEPLTIQEETQEDTQGQNFDIIDKLREFAKTIPNPLININSGDKLLSFIEGSSLYDLINSNQKIKDYLATIPVIKDNLNSFFDGNVIGIRIGGDLNRVIAHEVTHAVLDYSLQNDPEFAKKIKKLQGDAINEFSNKAQITKIIDTAFTLYNSFGKNQQQSFSQYFASQQNFILKSVNATSVIVGSRDMRDAYAFTGPNEFLAALMSDSKFRDQLSKPQPTKEKTTFQKFIDAVVGLFKTLTPEITPTKLQEIESFVKEYVDSDTYHVEKFIISAKRSSDSGISEIDQLNPLYNHPDLSYSIGAGIDDGSLEYKVLYDSQRMQRGYPEIYATIQSSLPKAIQSVGDYATGIRTSIYEHIGDLAHRAGSSHLGAMVSKVKRHALAYGESALMSRLQKEIEIQDRSNAAFQIATRIEKAGGKYDIRAAMESPEFETELKKATENNKLLDASFAAMYSRLQSFTPLQAAGRNMAIAFGMQRYSMYHNLASKIDEFFQAVEKAKIDPEQYYKFGFDVNGVNNLSRTDNQLKSQWETNQKVFKAHLDDGNNSQAPTSSMNRLRDQISHDALSEPIAMLDDLIAKINNGLAFSKSSDVSRLRNMDLGDSDSKKEKKAKAKARNIQIQQLKDLKSHKIEDKFDSNTSALLRAVKLLKPSRIKNLPPVDQDRVWKLVSNIYEARSKKITNPQARVSIKELLDELNTYQGVIDSIYIETQIKALDGVYDMGDVEFNGDIKMFQEYLDELHKQDEDFQRLKNSINAKRKAAYTKKMEAWRKQFKNIRDALLKEFPSAEDYLSAYETNEGKAIKGKSLREFLMMHYDYLTKIADVSAMEGNEMFLHFFAINNLSDQSFMYGGETTAKYIANIRDSQLDVTSLEKMFRDPVINQGVGFFGGLDAMQRATEIAQSQLDRWSPFIQGKKFLEEDLMGPLLEAVRIESQNDEATALREYDELKKKFQEIVGRDFNGEDAVSMAIASRLLQYEYGKDGNKEFLNNIKNELQNIANIVGDETAGVKGAGSASQQRDYRRSVIPVFEKLIAGLDGVSNPMEEFVININSRLGLGDAEVGKARADLLNQMQAIMERFTLSNKVISELFYKKPFREYVNYLPNYVIPINPEQYTAGGEIADEMDKFDNLEWQTNSLTTEPGQVQTRKGIGKKGHYTNNIEFIFSRGIHVNTLTASTTPERFILNARLKGKVLKDLINGSDNSYRVDQLQHWARTVMAHAMHSGNPLGTVGVAVKTITEGFARVALSGLHQGLTQTISGFTDYQIRTGNIAGAMQSAGYYIMHKEEMDNFFRDNAAWIDKRSFMGEQNIDRRRNPTFDDDAILNSPLVKKLTKIHEKAGEIITYSLRKGDDFTARSLILAEYARLIGEKNSLVKSIEDVDFTVVEGRLLSQAISNIERNINASNKATRGEFFVDRKRLVSTLRNVTVAFSSHILMLSAQFNIAARDLIDLHKQGGSSADKMLAIRTLGAILGQTFMFSSSRYLINGALATGMIAMMRDLFDDEEGKIAELEEKVRYAKDIGNDKLQEQMEHELKMAKTVAKAIDTFKQRSLSFDGYWKSVVKDELGAVHFLFNGPGIPQRIIFPTFDRFGEMLMDEDKEARADNLKRRIKGLKERGKYGQVARLEEELMFVENQEYMPWHIKRFDSSGLGGISGSALDGIYKSIEEFNDGAFGLNEININDFILSAQAMGIGQADLNRWFKFLDGIEDEEYKSSKDRNDKRKKRQEEIARERRSTQDAIDEDRVLQSILND